MSVLSDQERRGFERVSVFVSRTGTVHYAAKHQWGIGALCTDRYLTGRPESALRHQVDCGRCRSRDS